MIENKTKKELTNFLKPIFYFLIVFVVLMFPFLVSPYIESYISFGGNLLVQSLPWNPFYIGYPFTFASYLLLLFSLYILVIWYQMEGDKRKLFFEGAGFIPLLGLYGFLMIYRYAFPWYWMWSIPLYAVLPVKTRKIFVIFVLICIIAAIEFINWTVGYSSFINYLFVFKS